MNIYCNKAGFIVKYSNFVVVKRLKVVFFCTEHVEQINFVIKLNQKRNIIVWSVSNLAGLLIIKKYISLIHCRMFMYFVNENEKKKTSTMNDGILIHVL